MIFEANILFWIQETLRNPILDKIFFFLSYLAEDGILPICVCVLLLCIKRTRKIGLFLAVILIVSTVLNTVILKHLFNRARPYDQYDFLKPLIYMHDSSFPSGHTCCAFAVFYGLKDFIKKNYKIILCIVAVLIGFSRLYLGVHYPSDVLGGIVVAYISYLFVSTFCVKIIEGRE